MECKQLGGCIKIINCCGKGDGSDGSGIDGKSAYEVAVENGFDGTEQDWLDSLIGNDGNNGWTPILANITDGDRIVQQVIDWTGGTGEKLETGLYVGASGLVSAIAQAIDIRGKIGATGAQGPQGLSTLDYSTVEQLTGNYWFDGKPIYQKTINFGALPNATSKTVAHNINNLDFVTSIKGVASDGTQYVPLPYIDRYLSAMGMYITKEVIYIDCSLDHSYLTKTYITLQYTKTS